MLARVDVADYFSSTPFLFNNRGYHLIRFKGFGEVSGDSSTGGWRLHSRCESKNDKLSCWRFMHACMKKWDSYPWMALVDPVGQQLVVQQIARFGVGLYISTHQVVGQTCMALHVFTFHFLLSAPPNIRDYFGIYPIVV